MALSNAGRRWTEQETLLAMELYLCTPFGQIHAGNPKIVELARLLGRTPDAVAMKMSNLARFDPNLKTRNVRGLSNGSKQDGKIFEKYYGRFDELAAKADEVRRQIEPAEVEEYDALPWKGGFSRTAETRVRVGQNFFRTAVLNAYGEQCCITGLRSPALLVASHIKPWSKCATPAERTDPRNGLCLNALHDAAFDSGLITVTRDHRLVFSRELEQTDMDDATKAWLMSTKEREIVLPERFLPSDTFLEFHNDVIFRG